MDLGLLYEYGDGLPQNMEKAVQLYRLAANGGNEDAQFSLGHAYETGQGGLKKDLKEAARLYELAAQKGNVQAMNSLGDAYQKGKGVKKDPAAAMQYYRKAFEKGSMTAAVLIGALYEKRGAAWQRTKPRLPAGMPLRRKAATPRRKKRCCGAPLSELPGGGTRLCQCPP